MKKSTLLAVMALLLSLAVASAYAQTAEPSQTQTKTQAKTQTQTQSGTMTQTQTQTGTMNQGAADQIQVKTQSGAMTQAQTGRPVDEGETLDKVNDEADMTQKKLQKRLLNFENANGSDAFGGIERHGGDFVGEGGPHGPMGSAGDTGDADELLKFLGLDEQLFTSGEQTASGSANHYGQGLVDWSAETAHGAELGTGEPGPFGYQADVDQSFGPLPNAALGHAGDVTFGPGGSDDPGESDGTSPSGVLAARQGRR